MCGIIGLRNGAISNRIYTGLYAMQHRGQDSAGILTYNREYDVFSLYKRKGLVFEIFDENVLKDIDGDVGIGQVRYPTVGSNFEADAQPFLVDKPLRLGMAHNGNIANYIEMRNKLNEKITSECDVEIILHLLAEELKKEKDVFNAVENIMKELNGSYSVVAISPEYGFIVFRDPHAIRPLVLSENGAASETVALDMINERVIRDVKPGECVVVNDGGMESKQLVKKEPKHCMFEWVYFSRPDSTIENRSVYEVRVALGRELAKIWDKDADVVIPVPDTSRAAAIGFSEETGIPYREGFIKNRYVGRTFIMPKQTKRIDAVRIKLNPIIREVKNKRIALIDDSIVRGTTCGNLIKLLKNAGAKEVHFLVSCPPIRFPCFYGIDMTRKKELIAQKFKPDELEEKLAKMIGADSVTYQTIEGLKRAIGVKGLCAACLDGNYPTDVSSLLKRKGEKRPYEVM